MAPRVAERAALAPADRSVPPRGGDKEYAGTADDNGKSLAHNVGNILGVTRCRAVAMRNTEQDEKLANGNKRIVDEFLFMSSPQ